MSGWFELPEGFKHFASELEDSISDSWWGLVSKAIDEPNLPNVDERQIATNV